MNTNIAALLVLSILVLDLPSFGTPFVIPSTNIASSRCTQRFAVKVTNHNDDDDDDVESSRRSFLTQSVGVSATLLLSQTQLPYISNAEEEISSTSSSSSPPRTSANAEITSKIFLVLKGLPTDESNDIDITPPEDIITIGLFGNDASQPVSILKQLVSDAGLPTKCKPKETRTLQREQLEANKVYNSCMESESSRGVTYDLSTVWRVIKDQRIDLGAVSGKFVSRESPVFEGGNPNLHHDLEGIVSVRKGSDGAFGLTIYPGTNTDSGKELDEDNIVVGRVIGGMDVVRRLNQIPVVQSAKFGSGAKKRSSASRACRYGSSEYYCNEFKPLKKVLIQRTGTVADEVSPVFYL